MGFVVFLIVLFAVILPIAGTILAYIFLIPERGRMRGTPLMERIRNFLIMRNLVLERVVRALYVFFAMLSTFGGFIMGEIMMVMALGLKIDGWSFGGVLLGILVGVIVGVLVAAVLNFSVRILFENIMLQIRLVKNTDVINEKLGGGNGRGRSMEDEYREVREPRRAPAPAPRLVRCRDCGARFDPRRGGCPNGCDDRW